MSDDDPGQNQRGNPLGPEREGRRSWRSISLRGMLLLVLVVGLMMGWWARKSQLQKSAVARIEALGGSVLYDFEVRDAIEGSFDAVDRRLEQNHDIERTLSIIFLRDELHSIRTNTSAPSGVRSTMSRRTDWLRNALGVDHVNRVTHAFLPQRLDLREGDLAFLADLPRLEHLELADAPISDRDMIRIGQLTGLKFLQIEPKNLTEAGFVPMESLDQLESLRLYSTGPTITDSMLARLEGMKKLRFLSVASPKITDAGIASLGHLTSLENLNIDAPNVTEEGMARLCRALPKLVGLWTKGDRVQRIPPH